MLNSALHLELRSCRNTYLLTIGTSRCSWISLALLIATVCSAQSLRQEADRRGILVGTAVNPVYLDQPAYATTLAREFNLLEPEDAMKWTALRRDEQSFDFSAADRLVDFAQAHGMKVRGHNLVWGIHNPKWLSEGNYNADQLHALMQEHIRRVVGRYRGKVFAWDVVNEAFDEHGELRDSIWYNQPGIGLKGKGAAYIEQVFRWAREADPQAKLFYNEAEAEALTPKSDAVYAMVRDFKQRGVPIDGVGVQMHIFNLAVDTRSVAANIKRLVKLGLEVQITEMDVALPVDSSGVPLHPEDLQRQAEIYRQIAGVCVKNRGCTAFQTWGFTDKYSWVPRFTHWTKGAALPLDTQYRPKPAYQAIADALAGK
jgi:endo-1,4-beta-xylanase